jgi:hypothetical protein
MTVPEALREPRAIVVFESMFGNTERVARSVARGLEAAGVPTRVSEVTATPAEIPATVDLLVVGAPTHAFSLSRPKTRIEAVRQGADEGKVAIGLREWLETVSPPDRRVQVAVYDTRVKKVRRLPAAAGPSAARLAKRRGFAPVDHAVAFLVEDMQGPLAEGETERAISWGGSLAAEVLAPSR